MSLTEDRLRLLGFPAPWQRAAPKPDLLDESEQRARTAAVARELAFGVEMSQAAAERLGQFAWVDSLAEPYGPDPVVFGSGPGETL